MAELPVGVSFRTLTSKDVQQIVSLEQSALRDPALCLKSELADIEKSCSCGCSHALTVNNEIIAYTLCYANEYGVGFIEKCFVALKYRGSGFQKFLVATCLLELCRRDVREVFTMTSPFNEASLHNFESVGFRKFNAVKCGGFQRIVLKYEIGN